MEYINQSIKSKKQLTIKEKNSTIIDKIYNNLKGVNCV